MNHNSRQQGSGLGAAIIIVAGVFIAAGVVYGLLHLNSSGRGGTSNADEIILDSDLQAGTFVQAAQQFILGGAPGSGGSYSATTMRSTRASIGSCAGAATSTQFAIANPYSSTSTVEIQVVGTVSSSTALKVGTSTTAFPNNTASNVSATLINTTLATSTPFAVWSGIAVGSAGYPGAGASTFSKIVVGPNDYVVGYASSSFSTGVNVGVSGCTYKGLWQN